MRKRLPTWLSHVVDTFSTVAKIIESHALLGALVSGALGLAAVLWAQSLAFFSDQRTQVAIGVSLAILWTYIGLRTLANMRAVQSIRNEPDYRHCISPEGYQLLINPKATDLALAVSFNFRNASIWPLGLMVESFDLRIDDRVSANPEKRIEMILPRASARSIRSSGFKKEVLSGDQTSGTLAVTIVYGAPGEPPVRRYTFRAKLAFGFARDEAGELVGAHVGEESFEDAESSI